MNRQEAVKHPDGLRTARLSVRAASGAAAAADLALCGCGSDSFHIFTLDLHDHPHLQCASCGAVYCTRPGACFSGEAAVAPQEAGAAEGRTGKRK